MPVLNAMTIDVEDYFHVSVFDKVVSRSHWDTLESRVKANTDGLLSLLSDADVRGTFFVLGWVAERFPDLIARIAAAGHEIASHGHSHRLIYDQTHAEFRADVRRSKQILESIIGARVSGYRAPSFSVTRRSLWALDVLIDEGFTYDSSVFPIHHDRYGIPEAPRQPFLVQRPRGVLVEVPASTLRVGRVNLPLGGGGYFRLMPYEWTRAGISHLNSRESQPAIFYLHPWEIDPRQPRLQANWLGRFRHYTNLRKTESALRRLLRDFRFGPLRTVLAGLPSLTPVQLAP
jgi:polysaccharide deacetylase family protein (PEP-CTERM system associated)